MNKYLFKSLYLFLSRIIINKITNDAKKSFRNLETKCKQHCKNKADLQFLIYIYIYIIFGYKIFKLATQKNSL